MAGKTSGIGSKFFVGKYDISGDVGSVETINGSRSLLDVTGLDKTAHERLGGLRDGQISFMSFMNKSTTSGAEGAHTVLKAMPLSDIIVTYMHQQAIGNPAASMVAKQVDYNPTRGADGHITMKTQATANGYGLQWGKQLTTGLQTHASAANNTAIDGGAATNFGATAYMHVVSLASGTMTGIVQHSADNVSFAAVGGMTFTAATAGTAERKESTLETTTILRYVRFASTGTFSNAKVAVMFDRHRVLESF